MQQFATTPMSPVRVSSDSAYSISNPPSSPSPSASGSELSFASDTETESNATDFLTTPPTSPTKGQQQFKHMRTVSEEDGSSSSSTLESVLSALKIGEGSALSPSALASLPKVSSPFATFPPSGGIATPMKTRPGLSQSLSARKPRPSPGTIDLSSLPRFPTHDNAADSPVIAGTPQGSSNAATPKAGPERPGLFSRWSTDSESSEGDDEDEDGEGSQSSCTSEDCETCEQDDNNGAFSKRSGSLSPRNYFNSSSPRPSRSPYNPFFLSPSAAFEMGPILSPLPASVSCPPLAPPAPKPHQHGFSPFVEEPRPLASSSSSSSSSSALSPSATSSSVATLSASTSCGNNNKKAKKSRRSHHHHRQQDSASPTSSSDSPDSSPGQSGNSRDILPDGKNRLTRSQGLRIRDEGYRPRGRYARSLSLQLQSPNNGPSDNNNSTMKTANALLGGTISPSATSTDPLRVRLREMPGAITPDNSLPPSPSPASAPHQLPKFHRSLSAKSWLGNAGARTPSSPLHVSSLPGSGDEEGNGKDTRNDLFSKSFAFAASTSSSKLGGAATPVRSPTPSPLAERKNAQDNPYFAGYI